MMFLVINVCILKVINLSHAPTGYSERFKEEAALIAIQKASESFLCSASLQHAFTRQFQCMFLTCRIMFTVTQRLPLPPTALTLLTVHSASCYSIHPTEPQRYGRWKTRRVILQILGWLTQMTGTATETFDHTTYFPYTAITSCSTRSQCLTCIKCPCNRNERIKPHRGTTALGGGSGVRADTPLRIYTTYFNCFHM